MINPISKCPKIRQDTPTSGHPGFTLVEILIVVAIIGVVSAVAVPNFIKARTSSQVKACISNLKQIQGAKAQWSLEQRKADTAIPATTDLAGFFNSGTMPTCPANGSYRIRRVSRDPTCTFYSTGHSLANLNMDDDPAAD